MFKLTFLPAQPDDRNPIIKNESDGFIPEKWERYVNIWEQTYKNTELLLLKSTLENNYSRKKISMLFLKVNNE